MLNGLFYHNSLDLGVYVCVGGGVWDSWKSRLKWVIQSGFIAADRKESRKLFSLFGHENVDTH